MPVLSPECYGQLKVSIEEHGIQEPVVVDETNRILDGFMRAQIAEELGKPCPSRVVPGLTEKQKLRYVYHANLHRRHFDHETVATFLWGLHAQGKSLRLIHQITGIAKSTVADALARVRDSDTLPDPATVTGLDGKVYPALRVIADRQGQHFPRVPKAEWPQIPLTPWFEDDWVRLYRADSREFMGLLGTTVAVSDPPYNVEYPYRRYRDDLSPQAYADLLRTTLRAPSIVVHYPERIPELARALGVDPVRVAAWVFNTNLARQFRAISWFGLTPEFDRWRQPYKNPRDARIKAAVAAGREDARGYDWWEIPGVQAGSHERTDHPAQLPVEVARRALTVTPGLSLVADPFCGSGAVLLAARELGIRAVGFEIDAAYCEMARAVLSKTSAAGPGAAA
jgi:hypothetical protein